ncbi:Protein F26E4.6 [Aphelenchoides avenae]|nr:Protein F26E4.6 [Aphelenchus avenae]KAH7709642.1 Protein F26E4.6 [Aphelenchus avenae]
MLRYGLRSTTQAVRKAHHGHGHGNPYEIVNWQPQTPTGPVHDGWATSRVPFSAKNGWAFIVKATVFLGVGFWAPFFVVDYQLRKANQ